MPDDGKSCLLRALGNATRNSAPENATAGATGTQLGGSKSSVSPMTGRELRAQLKAQQGRRMPATLDSLPEAESCGPKPAAIESPAPEIPAAPGTERRRAKAVTMLADNPNWKRAVVVEAGPTPVMGVAIRGVAYGEIKLPDDYNPRLVLRLLDHYGTTSQ